MASLHQKPYINTRGSGGVEGGHVSTYLVPSVTATNHHYKIEEEKQKQKHKKQKHKKQKQKKQKQKQKKFEKMVASVY